MTATVPAKSPVHGLTMPIWREVDRQLRQRAGVADELDLPHGDRIQAVEVPHHGGGAVAIQPHRRTSSTGMLVSTSAARCKVAAAAAGPSVVSSGKAVEQQIQRTRITRRRREGLDGAADLQEDIPPRKGPRRPAAPQRPGRSRAQGSWSKGSSCLAAFSSSARASLPRPEAKATCAAQQVDPGVLELAERPGRRRREQFQALPKAPALHAGLRRGQRAVGVPGRVGSQQHRPLEERRRGGQPAAGLRPAGRALEFSGDLLVRPGAAWARCQARRSGSATGSVASASAACTCWRSWNDADR